MSRLTVLRCAGAEHLYEVFLDGIWQAKVFIGDSGFNIVRGFLTDDQKFAVRAFMAAERVGIGPTLCAWCAAKGITTVLKAGDPKLPVSHGLCPSCREQLEREVA